MITSHRSKLEALRPQLQALAVAHGSPFYVFQKKELVENMNRFKRAFDREGMKMDIFFAIKSNPYPGLLRAVVEQGEGLDASSPRELRLALEAGAEKILYTGPAKAEDDFELIVEHADKIVVNLESRRELDALARVATAHQKTVRCGLRVTTQSQGGWTKFGLPLSELRDFYDHATSLSGIKLCGIHFHISMNETPEPYLRTLQEVAATLREQFTPEERATFDYLDMGGGFYPEVFEGIYPWNPEQEMKFFAGEDHFQKILRDEWHPRFLPIEVSPIELFGEQIGECWKNEIMPLLPNARPWCEPGRFLCHNVLHMVMTLIDIKAPQIGIVDSGNNMIGWEKYQFFNYVPILNLTRWNLDRERPFILYGSLCTPDDVWGYYLTGDDPHEGDLLVMPFQGAYTYTLAQNFIKDIPPVVDLG